MANTVSAAKNARKAQKRHIVRVSVKSELKSLRKKTLDMAEEKKPAADVQKMALQTVKSYAKAGSNNYIHPRTASRKIGRMMKQLHKLHAI